MFESLKIKFGFITPDESIKKINPHIQDILENGEYKILPEDIIRSLENISYGFGKEKVRKIAEKCKGFYESTINILKRTGSSEEELQPLKEKIISCIKSGEDRDLTAVKDLFREIERTKLDGQAANQEISSLKDTL